jgi:hypothetical protein
MEFGEPASEILAPPATLDIEIVATEVVALVVAPLYVTV